MNCVLSTPPGGLGLLVILYRCWHFYSKESIFVSSLNESMRGILVQIDGLDLNLHQH